MGPTAAEHDSLSKRAEYALKRAQLWLLTRLASLPTPGATSIKDGARVCIIRLNNIGDALVVTPLLRALKEQRSAHVTVICSPRNRVVFAGHPDVDEVIVHPKGVSALWRYAQLRRAYDAVLDLHDDASTTAAYLVALTRAPVKVALAHGLDELYSATAPLGDIAHEHVLRRLLRVGELVGLSIPPESANVVFPLPEVDIRYAKDWLQQRTTRNASLVGVNLSAGTAARYWAPERWAAVVGYLTSCGLTPIVLAAPNDRSLAHEVSALSQSAPVYIESNYRRFAAILPQLSLLVTPDTAIVHLASAFKVPVVGLYVQVRPEVCIWYPYQSRYVAYQTGAATLAHTLPEDVISIMTPFVNLLGLSRVGNR
jgi:ADP-heptose:LPS heptosyltransferase